MADINVAAEIQVTGANEAAEQVNKINQSVDGLQQSTQAVGETVGGVIKGWRALMQEAEAAYEEGNKQLGDKLRNEAAKAKFEITELRHQITALGSSANKLQAVSAAARTMVGAFGAAAGMAAMLAGEDEKMAKSLLKVQEAMLIIETLKGFAEMSKEMKVLQAILPGVELGFKSVRAAMITTGIGALVVGLGLLIANWDAVKDAMMGVSEQSKTIAATQKALDDAALKAADSYGEEVTKIGLTVDAIKSNNTSLADKKRLTQELIDQHPGYFGNLDKEHLNIEQLTKDYEALTKVLIDKATADALVQKIAENNKKIFEIERQSVEESLSFFDKVMQYSVGGFGGVDYAKSKSIKNKKENTKAINEENEALTKQVALLLAKTKNPTEVDKTALEAVKKSQEAAKLKLETQTKLNDELFKIRHTEYENERKLASDAYFKTVEDGGDKVKAMELYLDKIKEINYKEQEDRTKQAQESIDLEKKTKDELDKIDADNLKKKKEREDKEFKDATDTIIQKEQLATAWLNMQFEKGLMAEQDYKMAVLKMHADMIAQKIVLDTLYNKDVTKLLLDLSKTQKDISIATIKVKTDEMQSMLTQAQEYTQSVSGLSDMVSAIEINNAKGNVKAQDEIKKAAFERNKDFQIAEATVNYLAGIIKTFSNNSGSAFNWAEAIALAASLTGVYASNIAKIEGTQYTSTSTATGSSAPSFSVNAVQLSTPGQEQATQAGYNSSERNNGKNTKVFVTETDITNAQHKVANIKAMATFH